MSTNPNYMILVDNISCDSELKCEHGLSILCRVGKKQVLVDTGSGEALFYNAERKGIDLSEIDNVIITHGHDDHAGGLLRFLSINSKAKVFLMNSAFDDHFLFNGVDYLDIGIDRRVLNDYTKRIVLISHDSNIMQNFRVLSVTHREYPLYPTNSMLFIRRDGTYYPDAFAHELIVLVESDSFVDVITGCSHNGIINMITTVKEKTDKRIRFLFGGFHTGDIAKYNVNGVSNHELEQLALFLQNADIGTVFTMHCTGKPHFDKLRSIMGQKIEYACAGLKIANSEYYREEG